MIDPVLARNSISVAMHFGSQGIRIDPNPNSVLQNLVSSSNCGLLDLIKNTPTTSSGDQRNDNSNIEDFVSKFTIANMANLDTPSDHDLMSDSLIKDISGMVKSHFYFAKNVVIPIIAEYLNRIQAGYDNIAYSDPASAFNIKQMYYPPVLLNQDFKNIFKSHKGKSFPEPKILGIKDEPSDDELYQMLLVGNSDYDNDLKTWIEELGINYFKDLWHYYFGEFNKIPKESQIHNSTPSSHDDANKTLAVYLISTKLFDNPRDLVYPVSLSEYRDKIFNIKNWAMSVLATIVARIDLSTISNQVVLSVDSDNKMCKVDGHNYNKWIKEGGTPECILGLIVNESNQKNKTPQALNDNKNKLINDWNSYISIVSTSEKNRSFNRFKQMLLLEFSLLLRDLTPEEKEFISQTANYATIVEKHLYEQVNLLTISDMSNLSKVARKIVCKARFYYTSANRIIEGMEEAELANPNIKPREAALVSMINYVSNYLFDQMKLNPL